LSDPATLLDTRNENCEPTTAVQIQKTETKINIDALFSNRRSLAQQCILWDCLCSNSL